MRPGRNIRRCMFPNSNAIERKTFSGTACARTG